MIASTVLVPFPLQTAYIRFKLLARMKSSRLSFPSLYGLIASCYMGTSGIHFPVIFRTENPLALERKRPASVKEVEANGCLSGGPQGGCPGEALAALGCP